MATLILAEAGATVVKVERAGRGDDMRSFPHRFGGASANFALLNRGKTSLAIDLKSPGAVRRLRPLLQTADVLVEQFRPGVMQRLGLGYEEVSADNRRLVYCSITGYGQQGERSREAGHDLNYVGDSGMLMLTQDSEHAVLPPALVADIGGGAYPAVMNILLALQQRRASGRGMHLDIAMADNVFPFMYWVLGQSQLGVVPKPGADTMTGGSPRYQLYRTRDDRMVAAAPLEQKFWERFCEVIDLDPAVRDDTRDPALTTAAVAEQIRAQDADHWRRAFAEADCCCTIAATVAEARGNPRYAARGLFGRRVTAPTQAASLTALPLPLAPALRVSPEELPYPESLDTVGEDTELWWPDTNR
jgi:crotonobetainyl-CoA:carnitine CoA-transferase CaiB-like acyl-CoA transferase